VKTEVTGLGRSIIIVTFLLIAILITSCSQTLDTAIQDLSRATPTAAAVADKAIDGSSSYVKLTDIEEELDVINEDELEKRVYREGDLIEFDPVGVDPDGDIITYSYSLPLESDGSWQTDIGDEGTYIIKITASDGKTEVEKQVLLLILSANRAPTINNLEDVIAQEGDLITLRPRVFDYNGDEVIIAFSKPFNEDGEWQTTYEDSGTYLVKVTATDEETTVEKQVSVVVEEVNRAPVLNEIEHISTLSGETITIDATATDPDGDDVIITYSKPINLDGTWTPTEADLGTYAVTVTASDYKDVTEKVITVIVNHKNMAPVISIDDEIRAEETDRVVLKPVIVDPEGGDFTVKYSEPFDQDGVWTTDYDSAGSYDVMITATDEEGASSEVTILVTIYDRNRPPAFTI
jgi:hypothetical protein